MVLRMNKRTKAVAITQDTKKIVHERDQGCCILCGTPVTTAYSSAHYVPRSKGGLGIKENIVTLCFDCHAMFDQTVHRSEIEPFVKKHLNTFYPEFSDNDRIYRK